MLWLQNETISSLRTGLSKPDSANAWLKKADAAITYANGRVWYGNCLKESCQRSRAVSNQRSALSFEAEC